MSYSFKRISRSTLQATPYSFLESDYRHLVPFSSACLFEHLSNAGYDHCLMTGAPVSQQTTVVSFERQLGVCPTPVVQPKTRRGESMSQEFVSMHICFAAKNPRMFLGSPLEGTSPLPQKHNPKHPKKPRNLRAACWEDSILASYLNWSRFQECCHRPKGRTLILL